MDTRQLDKYPLGATLGAVLWRLCKGVMFESFIHDADGLSHNNSWIEHSIKLYYQDKGEDFIVGNNHVDSNSEKSIQQLKSICLHKTAIFISNSW